MNILDKCNLRAAVKSRWYRGILQVPAFVGLFTGTLATLQYLILTIGALGTVYITYKIARKKALTSGQAARSMLPHGLLLLLLMAANFYIFSLPMSHRAFDTHSLLGLHADTAAGEISPEELDKKIRRRDPFVIIDVREAGEYTQKHISSTTLRSAAEKLNKDVLAQAGITKDKEIVVYGRSGGQSKSAAEAMRTWGFMNVRDLNGGIAHWEEDGFPLEKGDSPIAAPDSGEEQGAHISFDRLTHDFGEVPQFGGIVKTTFVVNNEGTENLEIGTITTSCSCTTASIAEKPIASGGNSLLTVEFNPNLHEEPKEKFKRTIFVPTNDPRLPEATLTIWVDILEGQ